MPLQLLYHSFEPSAETAHDVRERFEWGRSLTPASTGRARYEKSVRDLADYFYFVGAVSPDYAYPLQQAFVMTTDAQLANFAFTFPTWLSLLLGATDECVEALTQRLAADATPAMLRFTLEHMLAGICTPAALSALADYARERDRTSDFAALGFWIPQTSGAAMPRFMPHRLAARVRHETDHPLEDVRHPVGLPVSAVMADPSQDVVTWHYCSLDLTAIPGAPSFPSSRIHLVSPPQENDWTVYCALSNDGRYTRQRIASESRNDRAMRRRAAVEQSSDRGELLLLPYNDQLIYCNSHVQLTPDVIGDVGGPPIGLYPNPICPECDRLMFHIATMTSSVREYGDGFRSLFLCEDCGWVASHATPWN